MSVITRKISGTKSKPHVVRVPFRLLPYACTLTAEEIIEAVSEKTSLFDEEIESSLLSFLGSLAYKELKPFSDVEFPLSHRINKEEEGLSIEILFPHIELYVNELTYKQYVHLSGNLINENLHNDFSTLESFVSNIE